MSRTTGGRLWISSHGLVVLGKSLVLQGRLLWFGRQVFLIIRGSDVNSNRLHPLLSVFAWPGCAFQFDYSVFQLGSRGGQVRVLIRLNGVILEFSVNAPPGRLRGQESILRTVCGVNACIFRHARAAHFWISSWHPSARRAVQPRMFGDHSVKRKCNCIGLEDIQTRVQE